MIHNFTGDADGATPLAGVTLDRGGGGWKGGGSGNSAEENLAWNRDG